MSHAPDRRPLRLGLLALVVVAVTAAAILPAATNSGGHEASPSPRVLPGPGPAAMTGCGASEDGPPAGALLAVADTTSPPATTTGAICGSPAGRLRTAPAQATLGPSPAHALAERARTSEVGCDEIDANEAQGLITAAETATLRVSTGCPVAPPVATTVRYQVAVIGGPQADLGEFRHLAARALADPRGWRGAGIAFVEVPEGADFTLWLAQAEAMPSFGEPCMSEWSCAAGADVVINDLRWREASPAWTGGGGTLADYRRMVLSHEVGHWLGLGHENCGAAGAPAPLMQQQSKDLLGCLPNAWPLPTELAAVAIGIDPGAGAWLAGG